MVDEKQKSIEKMYKDKVKRIDSAIQKKEIRQTKTEISIGFRWSVNVAVAFLPNKLKCTPKGFKQVEKWYPKFIDLDRNYMLENLPIESIKITKEDVIEALKKAPDNQALQDKADLAGAENKFNEDKEIEANETFDIASSQEE